MTQLFNALKKVLNFSVERYLRTAGNLFIYEGDYDMALQMVEKTLEIEPNDPRALALKGDILYCLNRDLEALDTFNKLLALHPASLEALVSKAAVLDVLCKYKESLECCNNALFLLNGQSHYLLASLYEQKLILLLSLRRFREAQNVLTLAGKQLNDTETEYLVANYRGTIDQQCNLRMKRHKAREKSQNRPNLQVVSKISD